MMPQESYTACVECCGTCSGVRAKNITLDPLEERTEISARSSMMVSKTSPVCFDFAAAIKTV